ncbi:MAG: ribonuclease HI family protein [Bdellovibrionaceae bacterium]|nr:ribonuclease HI family protein [Pseudobdellovibrionaceae bacterium]
MSNFIEKGQVRDWPKEIVIHTDGACRGNPGPSAIGLVVYDNQGISLYEYGEVVGENTNNYAEYLAVVRALELAKKTAIQNLTIKSDSQLLVRQLIGEYKVKSETLRPLYKRCMDLKNFIPAVSFVHVRREFNKKADELANLALDHCF